MPLEQFSMVIKLLPHIESELKGKGFDLPRPDYAAKERSSQLDDADEDEDVKDVSEEEEESRKKNFEETSEEEE